MILPGGLYLSLTRNSHYFEMAPYRAKVLAMADGIWRSAFAYPLRDRDRPLKEYLVWEALLGKVTSIARR
jgi:hypothetical protein